MNHYINCSIQGFFKLKYILIIICCYAYLETHGQPNVTISDLTGLGHRPVYASDDGSLTTGVTRYLSVPASAFHPSFDDNSVDWIADAGGAYFITNASSSASMIAPINLPHGCTIKGITVHYVDSDFNGMVNFRLGYFDNTTSSTSFFTATRFNSSGGSGNKTSTIDGLNIQINNIDRAYHYRMSSCFPGTDCSLLNDDYRIRQVVIEYVE